MQAERVAVSSTGVNRWGFLRSLRLHRQRLGMNLTEFAGARRWVRAIGRWRSGQAWGRTIRNQRERSAFTASVRDCSRRAPSIHADRRTLALNAERAERRPLALNAERAERRSLALNADRSPAGGTLALCSLSEHCAQSDGQILVREQHVLRRGQRRHGFIIGWCASRARPARSEPGIGGWASETRLAPQTGRMPQFSAVRRPQGVFAQPSEWSCRYPLRAWVSSARTLRGR
jgi:hypothetical protein